MSCPGPWGLSSSSHLPLELWVCTFLFTGALCPRSTHTGLQPKPLLWAPALMWTIELLPGILLTLGVWGMGIEEHWGALPLGNKHQWYLLTRQGVVTMWCLILEPEEAPTMPEEERLPPPQGWTCQGWRVIHHFWPKKSMRPSEAKHAGIAVLGCSLAHVLSNKGSHPALMLGTLDQLPYPSVLMERRTHAYTHLCPGITLGSQLVLQAKLPCYRHL